METQPKQNTEVLNSKMDTPSTIPTPTTINVKPEERQYAGFWIRFLAIILDCVGLYIIGFFFGASSLGPAGLAFTYTGWKVIVPMTYIIGFWIWKSATPGKIILGLKIVNEQGENINTSQSFIRFFSTIVSAVPFFIGFIWAGFEPQKRAWHDLLARTYVVKTK
ncbi:MAG: RDD family protein [Candidatus Magasanikbacteria bacterium]